MIFRDKQMTQITVYIEIMFSYGSGPPIRGALPEDVYKNFTIKRATKVKLKSNRYTTTVYD